MGVSYRFLAFAVDTVLVSTSAFCGYRPHTNGSLAVDIGLAVDFGLAIILPICHSWYAGRGSDRSFEGHPLA